MLATLVLWASEEHATVVDHTLHPKHVADVDTTVARVWVPSVYLHDETVVSSIAEKALGNTAEAIAGLDLVATRY